MQFLNEAGEPVFVREEIFWGTSTGWTEYNERLPSAALDRPIRVQFILVSDSTEPNGAGFYVDDLMVDD